MAEIISNLLQYLNIIYNFTFWKSLIIMAVLSFLYFFGCAFVPGLKKKLTSATVFAGLLLAFYLSQVIGITLLNRSITEEARFDLNLVEVYRIALNGNEVFFTQIIGNILMFVPFGILVPMCFVRMRGVFRMLILSFLFSIFIELTQLYTHTGLFELVDLLNNTLGGVIGYILFILPYKVYEFYENKKYKNILDK